MPEVIGYAQYIGNADIVGDDIDAVIDSVSGKVYNALALPQSFVGVPITNIPASSAGVPIAVPLLRAIRMDRFVIDRVVAASVTVVDIRVGTIGLNAGTNPVPGDAFAPDAVGTSIRAVVTAVPSVPVTVTIGNRTAVAVPTFTAAFFGPSLAA